MADTQLNIIISAQDNASSALSSVAGSANMLGSVLAALGIANITNDLIQLGKAAFETGYNFQQALQNIQGNTGLTNAQMKLLQSTVESMGGQSGANMDQLAQGFMHVYNITQSTTDSIKILKAAMEGANITGADYSDTANTLATIMHDFGANANDAQTYMAKLIAITQNGNVTLQDLNQGFTITASIAHSLGISIEDVGSKYDALTKYYGNANRANMELYNMMLAIAFAHSTVQKAIGTTSEATVKVTNNTQAYADKILAARDRLESAQTTLEKDTNAKKKNAETIAMATDRVKIASDALSALEANQNKVTTAASKADPALSSLAGDFSTTGLHAKGLTGIFDDITKAMNGNDQELNKLFPNIRSLQGALVLTTDGAKDAAQSLDNINKASSSTLVASYTQRVQSLNDQWGILVDTLKTKVITAFDALTPEMTAVVEALNWDQKPTVQKYNDVGNAVENLWKKFAAGPGASIGGGVSAIASGFTKSFETISKAIEKWAAGIPNDIKNGLSSAETTLSNWVKNVEKYFDELPGKAHTAIMSMAMHVLFDMGYLAGQLTVIVPKMIADTLKWFQNLPGNIEKTMKQTHDNVVKSWSQTQSDAALKFYQMTTDVSTGFQNILNAADTGMQNTWKDIIKWWTQTESDAALWLYKMTTDASNIIGQIPTNVHNIMVKLNKTVDDDLNTVWKTATKWWNTIAAIFNDIINTAQRAIQIVQQGFAAGQSSVQHRAGGGYASGLTLVGENGPELLQLPTGSYVHNNTQTNQMLGGSQVTIQFNGGVLLDTPERVKQLANQIIKIIGRQNELAQRGFSV